MSNKLYEFVSENELEDNENYEYFYEDVIVDDNPPSIQLCILSAINVGKIKTNEDLEDLCDLSVRSLDELIDFQGYPIRAAEIATRARRSQTGWTGAKANRARRVMQSNKSFKLQKKIESGPLDCCLSLQQKQEHEQGSGPVLCRGTGPWGCLGPGA